MSPKPGIEAGAHEAVTVFVHPRALRGSEFATGEVLDAVAALVIGGDRDGASGCGEAQVVEPPTLRLSSSPITTYPGSSGCRPQTTGQLTSPTDSFTVPAADAQQVHTASSECLGYVGIGTGHAADHQTARPRRAWSTHCSFHGRSDTWTTPSSSPPTALIARSTSSNPKVCVVRRSNGNRWEASWASASSHAR